MIAPEYDDDDDLTGWADADLDDVQAVIDAERSRRAAAQAPASRPAAKAPTLEDRVNAQWAAETGDKDAFTL